MRFWYLSNVPAGKPQTSGADAGIYVRGMGEGEFQAQLTEKNSFS